VKGITRKMWYILGAVFYIILAIGCVIGAYGVATTTGLSLSRRIFMILAFALGAFFLVCSAVGTFRRAWREDEQEDEEDD